jgi:hypothetical protein
LEKVMTSFIPSSAECDGTREIILHCLRERRDFPSDTINHLGNCDECWNLFDSFKADDDFVPSAGQIEAGEPQGPDRPRGPLLRRCPRFVEVTFRGTNAWQTNWHTRWNSCYESVTRTLRDAYCLVLLSSERSLRGVDETDRFRGLPGWIAIFTQPIEAKIRLRNRGPDEWRDSEGSQPWSDWADLEFVCVTSELDLLRASTSRPSLLIAYIWDRALVDEVSVEQYESLTEAKRRAGGDVCFVVPRAEERDKLLRRTSNGLCVATDLAHAIALTLTHRKLPEDEVVASTNELLGGGVRVVDQRT